MCLHAGLRLVCNQFVTVCNHLGAIKETVFNYCAIPVIIKMSKVEFILAVIEEAGWDYEELSQVSTQIDNFLEEDDLSELERESLTEIRREVCDKLEDIMEAAFEEQIDNEMEARAFLFNHIHHYPHINLDEEE